MPTRMYTRNSVFLLFTLLSACVPASPEITATPAVTIQYVPSPTTTIPMTPTPATIIIQPVVWTQAPAVPILAFHQFKSDDFTETDKTGMKLQLGELRRALQQLYDSGFSLVSLENWLDGDLSVPDGRRPLIISLDDVFYTNQLLLNANGEPSAETGIGEIWTFYQEHPDFGFHLALFANFGDKYYPFDPQYYPGRDWESEAAQVLVWCIENGAQVYNHTFLHGYLANVENPVSIGEFLLQLRQNDERLRRLLQIAGREDLIPRLANIIALTGGAEPQTESDWARLLQYTDPEGKPVEAILHIYHALTDPFTFEYLTGVYDPDFDPNRIPRIVSSLNYIGYLVEHAADFPVAQTCKLVVEESRSTDEPYLVARLSEAIQNLECPSGLYVIDGDLYDARGTSISRFGYP